jgi:16S rRNA (cytosine967-C5)-methyltransferase
MEPGLLRANGSGRRRTQMAISPARKIAYDVLKRVEAEGAYASDLLHTDLGAGVQGNDAALATELTMGVLRWRRLLDFLLEQNLDKPVARLDLPVALALRMGLYQMRFLERIPARAAVDESVELVKRARKSSAASLVNAVLRRMAPKAKSPADKMLPDELGIAERLGIVHSHPSWMVERWLARLGQEKTVAVLDANNRTPRLSCAPANSNDRDDLIRELELAGLHVESGKLLNNAFAVSGGSAGRAKAFQAGKISIQDEASQTIPLLLGVQKGHRVLDLCAAPGGKTAALVRAAGDAGLVVAGDLHGHRLRAMGAQFERLGLKRAHFVELDATKPLPLVMLFDRILVDAPCSGTGTLGRHPEIRWRLRSQQLAEFHVLQTEILRNACAQLASGGRLVYSTCSLEPEENEEVVDQILRSSPDVRRAPKSQTAKVLEPHLTEGLRAENLFDQIGDFRILPGDRESDGFFAAVVQKD